MTTVAGISVHLAYRVRCEGCHTEAIVPTSHAMPDDGLSVTLLSFHRDHRRCNQHEKELDNA